MTQAELLHQDAGRKEILDKLNKMQLGKLIFHRTAITEIYLRKKERMVALLSYQNHRYLH